MSRVGKQPVTIPGKTEISYKNKRITVKGEKGSLTIEIHPNIDLLIEDKVITVTMENKTRINQALQGMTRSLVNNMMTGVTKGFERRLEINGLGYRGEVKGKTILFNLGYSHPINFKLPDGISAKIDRTLIKLSGIDKQLLGQTAASIRKLRPPEPYKGKGIKFAEEYIQRKAGKTGTK